MKKCLNFTDKNLHTILRVGTFVFIKKSHKFNKKTFTIFVFFLTLEIF